MRTATDNRHRFGPGLAWTVLAWGLVLGAVLSLGGCGGGADQRDTADTSGAPPTDFGASDLFPVPTEIKPNVDFWRHVYGVWSRGQVAFHDDTHMGVIYEVARLPGPLGEGYTPYQKQFVESRKAYHAGRAASLEQKVRSGTPLTSEDQALLAKFEQSGGPSAVYGASERVRVQRGLRERFRRGVEISGRYDQAFREIMRANGVPEDLAYLPHVESSFQTNARSSVGAAGVWQFMPSTGRLYMNVNGTVDDRLDPILCANGAARYLSQAHAKLGSWPLAITSYNHGVGGMAKARAQHGAHIGRIVKNYDGSAFGFASRNFYSEFVAAREVARNAKRYFPEGVNYEQPWPHERVVLHSAMPASSIASQYGVSSATLASINLHWRDGAKSGRAELPAGTTVWVPSGSAGRAALRPTSYEAPSLAARSEPRREPAVEPEPESAIDPVPQARPAPAPAFAQLDAAPRASRPEPKPQPVPYRAAEERIMAVADVTPIARTERVARAERPEIVIPTKAKPASRAAAFPQPQTRPESKTPLLAQAKPEPAVAKVPEPKGRTDAKAARLAESKSKADAKPDAKSAKLAQGQDKADAKSGKTAKGDARSDAKSAKTAKADAKSEGKSEKLAKADAKSAKDAKGNKAETKFHVVKPEETLYRVATQNGLSVTELRKLNKMGPNDNHIRPGQKLKVDI